MVSLILLSIQILLVVDKVQFAVVGDTSYTVTDTRPTANVGMRCSPDWGVHQFIKLLTNDSSSLLHGRTTHHCVLTAYLNTVSNDLWPTLILHFMWHLRLNFAARFFFNMPYFRQSLSRNAITKFYQIWYTYRKTLRVDAYDFSSRYIKRKYPFYYVWKNIPILLNRNVGYWDVGPVKCRTKFRVTPELAWWLPTH